MILNINQHSYTNFSKRILSCLREVVLGGALKEELIYELWIGDGGQLEGLELDSIPSFSHLRSDLGTELWDAIIKYYEELANHLIEAEKINLEKEQIYELKLEKGIDMSSDYDEGIYNG